MDADQIARPRLWLVPKPNSAFAEALAELVERFHVPAENSRQIIHDLEGAVWDVRNKRDDALGR